MPEMYVVRAGTRHYQMTIGVTAVSIAVAPSIGVSIESVPTLDHTALVKAMHDLDSIGSALQLQTGVDPETFVLLTVAMPLPLEWLGSEEFGELATSLLETKLFLDLP
jgi:hypothetical protein